ncbi:MAG: hypothetical protein QOC80_1353 [Frankiaceae bacterium]|nr:hypothetical protein [Frankiaceae bacterium]
MTARRCFVVVLLLATLSGCSFNLSLSQSPGTGATAPPCLPAEGQIGGALVLMAQSVPSAQELPCLRRLPEGWSVGGFSARKGQSKMWLVVGRDNRTALTVVLKRRCDVSRLNEVQSEVAGAFRFERQVSGPPDPGVARRDPQASSGPTFRGTRIYVYPTSCLTYDYALLDAPTLPVLATAIGTIDRSVVAARVAEDSGGHLRLDPEPGRSS